MFRRIRGGKASIIGTRANTLSGQIGNIFQEAPSDGISEEPDTGEAEG
jgi:hypothetical protein